MAKKNPVPEPEKGLRFIDTHCHIPFPRPKNDTLPSNEEQYLNYFKDGGVYLITCSIDIETLKMILKFTEGKHNIGFTNGWAPQTVTYTPKQQYDNDWNEWIDFTLNHPDKYLGIGEIGLDFHHAKGLEKRDRQIEEFKKIVELTKDLDKPYTLHVRNATEHEYDREHPKHKFNNPNAANQEILKILQEFKIDPKKVMWHCFSGPDEYGVSLPKQGFTLSVPSSAYGFARWRKATEKTPLEYLVTETDSYYQHPYLRGPVNTPSNVIYAIAAIAHTHGVSQKVVSKKTIENAQNFFNLKS